MKRILVLLTVALCALTAAHAQTQMLLPYNDLAFQSSWANATVRPMHRYSIGIPVLSSIEFGVVNNGFSIRSVSESKGKTRTVIPSKLSSELQSHKTALAYTESSFDLLHFRMAWQRWFFWLGIRNQTYESLHYPTVLARIPVEGNKWLVGKRLDLEDTRFNLTNYYEFTLGASHPVAEDWVLGGRVSLLFGTFNGLSETNKLGVRLLDEQTRRFVHVLETDVHVRMSGIPTKDGKPQISELASSFFHGDNPGFALSGAVSYTPPKLKKLKLTFAFTDLGMIHWGNDPQRVRTKNKTSDLLGVPGYYQILFKKRFAWDYLVGKSFSEQLPKEFDKDTKSDSYNTFLAPKFYLMGTYQLARQTTAGLSVAGIAHQGHFYPSVTASIQQGYSAIFSGQFAVSYNQRSFLNFGLGLVFTPGAYQIYLITDNFYGALNPIDLKATNVRVGMNIVLGPLYPNNRLTQK